MNRRTAIRNAVIISAGAALLPSCLQQDPPSLVFSHLSLTGAQEKLLAGLCETIIPSTNNFIGAADLKAHEFVLTMVNDCLPPEERQQFTTGLKEFAEGCKNRWDRSFLQCTPQQRREWLQQLENKKDVPANATVFFTLTKKYTVQSFTSSKKYMTEIRNYQMVPGSNYRGCAAVNKA